MKPFIVPETGVQLTNNHDGELVQGIKCDRQGFSTDVMIPYHLRGKWIEFGGGDMSQYNQKD